MKTFTITAADMATLLLLNTALINILQTKAITQDVLEELKLLQPSLSEIIFKEESPLHHAS